MGYNKLSELKRGMEEDKVMRSKENDEQGKIIVPLFLICNAIEMADNEWNQYLDIEKMEVVCLPEYPFMGEYDEEEQKLADLIEEGFGSRFFKLPSKFDIHEYSIMERFIWNFPEGGVKDSLERAIKGKGAFRRFKDSLCRFGIEPQWYHYQAAAYQKLAIEWCEEHDFGYFGGETPSEPDNEENLAWEEISTEHIVQDEWIDFRRSSYRFPDGRVFEPFYSYSRRNYVVIVASDEEGNYLCVRQFRHGIKKVTTEFPAGGIEGAGSREQETGRDSEVPEDALEAAKRELLEETGYVSDEWSHLLTVPSNATLADNYAYIFTAKNCRKAGSQKLDETEFLNVRKYTFAEIEDMINKGEFQQAVHVLGWLLANR